MMIRLRVSALLAVAVLGGACRHVTPGQVIDVIDAIEDATKPSTPPSTPPVVVPPVEPEKPVEPPPVVVEPPVPSLSCPSDGGEYELLSRTPSPYSQTVNEVMGELVKETSGCPPDCAVGVTLQEATAFRGKVIAALAKRDVCAWLQEDTSDAPIAVGTKKEHFTHHILNYGGFKVRWQPSANEPPDRWRLIETVEKPVEPVPLPQACSPLFEVACHTTARRERIWACTPLTGPKEVCDSLGFVNRGSCPFGVEFEGRENPERIRCENQYAPYTCQRARVREANDPPIKWDVEGQDCGHLDVSSLMFLAGAPGTYRVCAANGWCREDVLR